MALSNAFTKPENTAYTYTDKGINKDLQAFMEINFPKAVSQCNNSYKVFKGKTPLETAYLIWLFLRKKCKYRKDSHEHQLIRNPAFFTSHYPHFGDCKTFATFARSVYASIYPELETAFKLTGYRQGQTMPSHVYTVVKDYNGKEIIIDGCWTHFNDEKDFTLSLKPKYKAMRITALSDNVELTRLDQMNETLDAGQRNKLRNLVRLRQRMQTAQAMYDGGHITKQQFQERLSGIAEDSAFVIAPNPTATKKDADKKPKTLKELEASFTPEQLAQHKKTLALAKKRAPMRKFARGLQHGFNLINLAPVRAGFLTFVAMNINGFAGKLKMAEGLKGGKKIYEVWHRFGGQKKMLTKAINKGAKNKPLFMSKKKREQYEKIKKAHLAAGGTVPSGRKITKKPIAGYEYESAYIGSIDNSIGIAPAVVAAIIAAATAIISAMIPIVLKVLENNGKKKEAAEVTQQGQDIVAADRAGQGYQTAFQDGAESDNAPPSQYEEEPMFDDIGNMDSASQTALISSLSNIAGKGIEYLGGYIAKKANKNPKLANTLQKGAQFADDYFTGSYMRKAGYKSAWQTGSKLLSNPFVIIGGGLLLGGGVYFLAKKK